MNVAEMVFEAQGHLGAAVVQSLPTDDQVIMEHVRAAYELTRRGWLEMQRVDAAAPPQGGELPYPPCGGCGAGEEALDYCYERGGWYCRACLAPREI